MTNKQSFSSNKNKSEVILYQTPDGKTKVDVRFEGETAWLSQTQMAELFETTKQNISLHVNNIYKEGELPRESTVKDYLTVQTEGGKEPQMGLTSFKGSKIHVSDVTIAKNYLSEPEIKQLNLIVSLYLDFAELQATNSRLMTMSDWVTKLDEFLKLSEKHS